MKDPVIALDGYTYERKAIQDWFGRGNRTSPMTRAVMDPILLPNRALKDLIDMGLDNFVEPKEPLVPKETKEPVEPKEPSYIEKVLRDGTSIKDVPLTRLTNELISLALEENCLAIAHISNPTVQQQIKAVQENLDAYKLIKAPSVETNLFLVSLDGLKLEWINQRVYSCVHNRRVIGCKHRKDPLNIMFLYYTAISQHPWAIQYMNYDFGRFSEYKRDYEIMALEKDFQVYIAIKNPTETTRDMIHVYHNPMDIVLGRYSVIRDDYEFFNLIIIKKDPRTIQFFTNSQQTEALKKLTLNTLWDIHIHASQLNPGILDYIKFININSEAFEKYMLDLDPSLFKYLTGNITRMTLRHQEKILNYDYSLVPLIPGLDAKIVELAFIKAISLAKGNEFIKNIIRCKISKVCDDTIYSFDTILIDSHPDAFLYIHNYYKTLGDSDAEYVFLYNAIVANPDYIFEIDPLRFPDPQSGEWYQIGQCYSSLVISAIGFKHNIVTKLNPVPKLVQLYLAKHDPTFFSMIKYPHPDVVEIRDFSKSKSKCIAVEKEKKSKDSCTIV